MLENSQIDRLVKFSQLSYVNFFIWTINCYVNIK